MFAKLEHKIAAIIISIGFLSSIMSNVWGATSDMSIAGRIFILFFVADLYMIAYVFVIGFAILLINIVTTGIIEFLNKWGIINNERN